MRGHRRETTESLETLLRNFNLILWMIEMHWSMWSWAVESELYFMKTTHYGCYVKNGLEGTSIREIKDVKAIVYWLPTCGYEEENFPHLLYLCLSELAFQVFLLGGFSLCLCQVGSPLCVNSQNLEFVAGVTNLAFIRCLAPVMACSVLSSSLL